MLYLEECKQKAEKYIEFANDIEGNNFPFTLDESSMIVSKIEYLKNLHEAVQVESREPSDALEIVAFAMAYFKLSVVPQLGICPNSELGQNRCVPN